MLEASWHVYQVLTKRAERLADFLSATPGAGTASHIWWGASVENKKSGVPRIQHLRRAPIRTRFLSVEPLLEDLGKLNLEGISWVIVGGESGRDARPMKREWVIAVRDQCRTADVPFFFKQWGGKNKRVTGRELDGTTHDEYPASETTEPPSRAERERLLQVTEAAASAFL
jgi:protein gp37